MKAVMPPCVALAGAAGAAPPARTDRKRSPRCSSAPCRTCPARRWSRSRCLPAGRRFAAAYPPEVGLHLRLRAVRRDRQRGRRRTAPRVPGGRQLVRGSGRAPYGDPERQQGQAGQAARRLRDGRGRARAGACRIPDETGAEKGMQNSRIARRADTGQQDRARDHPARPRYRKRRCCSSIRCACITGARWPVKAARPARSIPSCCTPPPCSTTSASRRTTTAAGCASRWTAPTRRAISCAGTGSRGRRRESLARDRPAHDPRHSRAHASGNRAGAGRRRHGHGGPQLRPVHGEQSARPCSRPTRAATDFGHRVIDAFYRGPEAPARDAPSAASTTTSSPSRIPDSSARTCAASFSARAGSAGRLTSTSLICMTGVWLV
jgi:hypothetical protein